MAHLSFFIGALIAGAVWLAMYLYHKDLRVGMLWGSLWGFPFGVIEIFYREYWNPPSLFNLINKIGFGIEDLMWAGFVAGIASVTYNLFTNRTYTKIEGQKKTYLPFVVFLGAYLSAEIIFPNYSIYGLIVAFVLSSITTAILRKDLVTKMLSNGFIFLVVYFVFYFIFVNLFPEFVGNYYSLKNISGIVLSGVPLEELVFAFVVGTGWSTYFETMKGFRNIKIDPH
ncbi:MAG: lycopene cyclase domain-containing protein [Candidatus Paceibacterota bacterium]|jgi:hypothetical protein